MPLDPRIEALVDRYPSLRAVGDTPLVPVDVLRRELPDVEVFAKMESLNPGGSLKDRPVLRMLLSAVDDGRLKPDKTVLDSSSGNAGIAYAMIGRIIGVPVEIVIPDNASAERKARDSPSPTRFWGTTKRSERCADATRPIQGTTSSAISTATRTTGGRTTRRRRSRSS